MENQFFNFKDTIKEFLRIDEEIRGLAKAKATRVKQRDKLSKDIMNYYKQNNIHSLDINNYDFKQQLALVESERHPSVNKKFLRTALASYCNNDTVVDKMIDYILDERTKNSKLSFKLKRIIPHNKKKNNNSSSSSSSTSTFDAMALVKENEKDKIKNRFARLADFAIIKDGIDPLNDTDNDITININANNKSNNNNHQSNHQSNNHQSNNNVKIITQQPSTLEFTKHQYNNKEENEEEEEFKNIPENYNENEEEDDDEVDLDNIPEENTGYSEEPPKVDIEIEKGNTIKNIICNKLDQMNQKEFIGSIPIPVSKKQQYQEEQLLNELEKKAIDSFNILKNHSKTYPILLNWLSIQQEKLKIIKKKDQIKSEQYIFFMNNLNNKEKEIDNKYNFNDDINKLKSNIVNYIVSKNKIK
jgi:hypothetical protein